MNYYELTSFILYFILVIGVGIYFFVKSKSSSEKDYFLGGRNMNGLVSAFSAGASDMSAWVLMGLPGSIYLYGLGQVWISIGLLIGTVLSWIFVAPRLRRFAIKADDAITIPQFLSNRFKSKSPVLKVACAVIFVIGYCFYSASSVYACGILFNTLIPDISKEVAMIIATAIILAYTLLGGFKAVCWTDFFQGMLMLAALMIVPIIAYAVLNTSGALAPAAEAPNYYNLLSSGSFDWDSVASILTGLGWGLGYFGMPHILVRFMAVKSEKEMKKSQVIGSCWTALILLMATIVGLVGHEYLGGTLDKDTKNLVFVNIVRNIFDVGALALIGGLLISAIVAASMSTADSQLLASSSAFASDFYKTTVKKDATDKEMLFVGRIAVAVISVIALVIALMVLKFDLGGIMELVSAAWSVFGAAFGPVILLSLYWKRLNYKGACAGIMAGFAVSVLWMVLFNLGYYGFNAVIFDTGLYEIIPGFIVGLVVAVAVSLCTAKPDKDTEELFDSVKNFAESEN
nr:sodium/proline symporter [Clostridia bacterium]